MRRVIAVLGRGVIVLIGIFLVLPMLAIVPMAFSSGELLQFPPQGFSTRWFSAFLTDEKWTAAIGASLRVALVTTVVCVVVGTLLAFALDRWDFRGKTMLLALVASPMIVPVVVIAIGMYFVYVRWHIAGSLFGFVVAHSVLGLPLVVVSVMTSLRGADRNLEAAAMSLGAGPIKTFFLVTLPLILPGVAAGALFAFITSWDEVVIAIFMVTPTLKTLPVVMFQEATTTLDPTLAAASTILLAITTTVIVAAGLLQGRKRRS
jgi:putative spermidine/putrescine transport system permease protein